MSTRPQELPWRSQRRPRICVPKGPDGPDGDADNGREDGILGTPTHVAQLTQRRLGLADGDRVAWRDVPVQEIQGHDRRIALENSSSSASGNLVTVEFDRASRCSIGVNFSFHISGFSCDDSNAFSNAYARAAAPRLGAVDRHIDAG
jgi:hypothetical protein